MTVQIEKTATPDPILGSFLAVGIISETYAHPPVFTVAEGIGFHHLIPGGHTKNLFLKDKKDKLWLVTAWQDTKIDLKWLQKRLSAASRLSFGRPALLQDRLNVTPGSVTPLALLHDTGRRVQPVIDKKLFDFSHINCHPLVNTLSTVLTPQDLFRWMVTLGYQPLRVDFADHRPIS